MKPTPFRSLWLWPIVMGALTTTGLLTALVSDTWGDWWSWVGLGVPTVVMGWYGWLRKPPSPVALGGNRPAESDLTTDPESDANTAGASTSPF